MFKIILKIAIFSQYRSVLSVCYQDKILSAVFKDTVKNAIISQNRSINSFIFHLFLREKEHQFEEIIDSTVFEHFLLVKLHFPENV